MFSQRDALLRLLEDDDAHTVQLVKEQLSLCGRDLMPLLLDLKTGARATVTRHVQDIIAQIDASEARIELDLLCNDFPEHGGVEALEVAAFLLARALLPGSDVENTRLQLDLWGHQFAAMIPPAATPGETIAAVTRFFGTTLELKGNCENYYSLTNSLLPEVIRSRQGIPLSLALIYLFVGARAGVTIEGVCFPGHFLVQVEGAFLDPFAQGKLLTPSDCADILLRQKLRAEVSYFENASAGMIFRRMLSNALYICQSEQKMLAPMLERWIDAMDRHLSTGETS